MQTFKDYLTEVQGVSKSDVLRVFEGGPGTSSGKAQTKKLKQIDSRTYDFTDKRGDTATLIFRGNNFVVFNSKGVKIVDSKTDSDPIEALHSVVWQ